MRKFLLLIALIISCVGFVNAQNFGSTTTIDYEGYSLKFTVTNLEPAECEVVCTTNKPTVDFNVVIPDKVVIEGAEFPVTRIGDNAFKPSGSSYYYRLKSVSIPNTVTSIGNNAFHECRGLSGITIPNSVTTIGSYAFYYCRGLIGITIPNSVITIGSYAFNYCDGLLGITIPNSVETMGDYVFSNCSKLSVVTFEEGSKLAAFSDKMFQTCSALAEINIPNSVTYIGGSAFQYCSSLTSIEIPNSVTSIGGSAFHSCSSLTSIEIPNSVTSIGSYAFASCSSLEDIIIPENITSLNHGVFSNCSKLSTVTIPRNVEWMGGVFTGCTGITTIVFESNSKLQTLSEDGGSSDGYNNGTFDGCSSLKNIILPNSLTHIGEEAFRDCSSLSYIDIPDNVAHIGVFAFAGTSLVDIEIPNGVISLGAYVFSYNSKLKNVVIPKTVTSIPHSAFLNCTSLQSIEIPNSITYISSGAFRNCTSLESIEIPNSVTSIGSSAFYSCTALENIEIPGSVTTIGSSSFGCCSKLESVYIANGVKTIESNAFQDCVALRDVTLPSSLTSIGSYAFKGCGLIERLRCFASTPPSKNANIFTALTDVMQIQVLESALAAYQSSIPWNYYTLVAFPDLGSSVSMNFGNYVLEFEVTNLERSYCSVRCSTLPTVPTVINIPGEIIINGITFDVATIADNAFANCTNITEVNIDNGVKTIGQSAFNGCNGITSIILPESVETLGKSAFANCSNLTGVSLPSSIKNIGEECFSNCKKLASIECNSVKVPTTSYNAFNYVPTTLSVQVPESAINSYKEAYPWKLYNIIPLSGVGTSIEITYDTYSLKYTITDIQPAECEVICSKKPNVPTTVKIPSAVSIGGKMYSVTSLGNYAFANSQNINEIKCYIEDVPTTAATAFDGLSSSIQIQVPATSLSSYQSASLWNNFNIIAGYYSNINVASNNTYNGSVSGGGTYSDGSMATLTAMPNENCTFVNWTENGQVVSTNLEYSFVVDKNRNLVANFISTNYWNPDYTQYANNMSITAIIQVDGIEHNVGTLELGAFCGEELRGSNRGVYESDVDRYIVYLTVCGNAGDEINFRLYDHITCEEKNYIAPEEIVFVSNDIVGNINEPYVFNFISKVNINASSNPTNIGDIEGTGVYTIGEEVTLTATSSSDMYYFTNWTENGNIVSENAIYTFVAERDRDLVANYSASNHWNPNAAQYSNSMTIIGVVKLEDIEQRTSNIEIGAFCGNETRGSQRLYYEADLDRYYLYLTIYGETNDVISFKLFDHSTHTESDLSHVENIIFEINGTVGNLIEPYEFNFISGVSVSVVCSPANAGSVIGSGKYPVGSTVTLTATAKEGFAFRNWTLDGVAVSAEATYSFVVEQAVELVANFNYIQTRELENGWNWYSTYVNANGSEGLLMMKESLGENGLQIKGQSSFVSYQNGIWYGMLNGISTDQMYMVKTSAVETLEMTGELIDPSECPIQLGTNWKWIAYPLNVSMNLSTALSNITPSNGDYIKSQTNGFAQYYETLGWRGTLKSLSPGQGYMYQNTSGSIRTLIYPEGGAKEDVQANMTSDNNIWVPNTTKYPHNMSVIAVIEKEGKDMDNYEIAAFSDGECRGSARPIYIEELDSHVVFLTIYGDDKESISFKLYDIEVDEEYEISNEMIFGANATVGDLMNPYNISLAPANVSEMSANEINIYPNPASVNTTLYLKTECERVEVYNVLGVLLFEYENVDAIEGLDTAGVYMIKVINNGVVKYDRIVIR